MGEDNKNIGSTFDGINAKYNSVITKFKELIRPVWSPISSFLSPVTKPINEKYKTYSQPIRDWHARIKQKSPFMANVVLWSYDIFRTLWIVLFVLIFLALIGVFGHMPDKDELRNIQNSNTTEIYSIDTALIGKFYIENRTEIGLEHISPYVVTALLAVEDKRFFEHSGIDLRSWLRVFKGIATNTSGMGGGSTLSQQLAKNLYPRRNYYVPGISILINKIRENIISIRLEDIYDKEQLLNLYLNTVPFGGDRFGINVASRYFFSKKAKDLNPAEAATLIGMLKATTALDPTRNPNDSKNRRNLVLSQMVKNVGFEFNDEELKTVSQMVAKGKVTQADYDKIKEKPINAKKNTSDDVNEGKGLYFREYLRTKAMPAILANLTKDDGSKYNLYRDGLKIYTTLDNKLQTYAEIAVQKHMSSLQSKFNKHWKGYKEELPWGDDKWLEEQKVKSDRYLKLKEANVSDVEIENSFNTPVKMTVFSWKNGGGDTDTLMTPMDSIKHYFLMLNTGFMAMDHSNGFVKAWVGGTNFKYFKFDHNLSKRQVGSTFKPIVYAAAVRDSLKPCQFFKNEQITVGDWSPRNSDETYGGWATMYGGLTYSINTIAAKLIQNVGIQKTLDLARAMGITSEMPREFGIALGATDISLFDMMKVYGTIANKGMRPEPVVVLKVTDRNGKVIYDYYSELKKNSKLGAHVQALSEDEAAIVKRMMQGVIDQGTGRKFRDGYGAVGEYAGKTGTTQNHSDGWFIVFNPSLVTGVWVGGPSRAVRFRDMGLGQGSSMALPIVGEFWKQIRASKHFKKYTDTKFEENEKAINLVGCPFRIYIHPDTLDLLMQDTFMRDSIIRNGYRGLKEIAQDKFGLPESDLPEDEDDGKEVMEGIPTDKKDSKNPKDQTDDKKALDKNVDPKKQTDSKLDPKKTTDPKADPKKTDDKNSPPKNDGKKTEPVKTSSKTEIKTTDNKKVDPKKVEAKKTEPPKISPKTNPDKGG